MPSLFEKHRPTSFSDVVGQDKAVKQVALLRSRGFGGRAIWLSGPSGGGKTTIARLIAAEVAEDWSTVEIDATGLTAADIERVADRCRGRTITGRGWCIIVNEAHGLTKDYGDKRAVDDLSFTVQPGIVTGLSESSRY